MKFYHGGIDSNIDFNNIDLLRLSVKQQNQNNSYAGFYMYGSENYRFAINYAIQENKLNHTTSKGVLEILMEDDLNIFYLPPFSITRISKEQIIELQKLGYDLIAGKMLGKYEYILINKNKVIGTQFMRIVGDNLIPMGKFKKNDNRIDAKKI